MRENKIASLREMLLQRTTEELEEMLDKELHSETVEEDAVRIILRILREREKDVQPEISPKMEAAWKQYRENTARRRAEASRVKRFRSRLIRAASVAVVAVALISVVPSQAGAQSFWERMIRWTDEFMELFGPNDNEDRIVEYEFQTDNPGLQKLYDTVVEQGVADPVVPMWLPDGYELVDIEIQEIPDKTMIYARFTQETERFTYQMHIYDSVYSHKFQRDDTKTKVLEQDGTKYYILRNNDMWSVVWTKENVECSICTDCQEEVLYQILDSV